MYLIFSHEFPFQMHTLVTLLEIPSNAISNNSFVRRFDYYFNSLKFSVESENSEIIHRNAAS